MGLPGRACTPPPLIRAPVEADLARLEALAARLAGPVLLTLAPETVDAPALRRLRAAGIVLSAGHSSAVLRGFGRCALPLA